MNTITKKKRKRFVNPKLIKQVDGIAYERVQHETKRGQKK